MPVTVFKTNGKVMRRIWFIFASESELAANGVPYMLQSTIIILFPVIFDSSVHCLKAIDENVADSPVDIDGWLWLYRYTQYRIVTCIYLIRCSLLI